MSFYFRNNSRVQFRQIGNFNEIETSDFVIPDLEDRTIMQQEIIEIETIRRVTRRISRITMIEMTVEQQPCLLACLHFPSKKFQDEVSQLQIAYRYKQQIIENNDKKYQNRIIVVGDFNMNPFDLGMVEPGGFYALNFSDVIRPDKIVHNSVEMMFYNPCWWLLGDYHPLVKQNKTSGSHYFEGAPSRKLYWHLFDQVILAPPLIPLFIRDDLEIIQVQEIIVELATKKPARKVASYSDHLPIVFSFNCGI